MLVGVVIVTLHEVGAKRSTPAELGVIDEDACVEDVRIRALAGRLVVRVLGGVWLPVRDPSETPWRRGLRGQGRNADFCVGRNVCDLEVISRSLFYKKMLASASLDIKDSYELTSSTSASELITASEAENEYP